VPSAFCPSVVPSVSSVSLEIELRADLCPTPFLKRCRPQPAVTERRIDRGRSTAVKEIRNIQVASDALAAEPEPLRQAKIHLALAGTIHRAWLDQLHIYVTVGAAREIALQRRRDLCVRILLRRRDLVPRIVAE